MYSSTFRTGLMAATVCLASFSAHSSVVLDNGLPDQIWGTNMSEQLVAENFSLSAATNITGIRLWSIQDAAAAYRGSVYWAIYSDLGGIPNAVLSGGSTSIVSEVATGNSTGFGYAEYEINIAASFNLAAGNYWLALHNGVLSDNSSAEMLWSTTGAGSADGRYLDSTFGWVQSGNEQAFQLEGTAVGGVGTVPEPSTLALMSLGLLAATRARQRPN
nr:PEP-CTERM sorting domain-containing protein [uncultured Roseateles sp.]